jgi:hypothetical protein
MTTDTSFTATGPANVGFLTSVTFSNDGAVLAGGLNGAVLTGGNNGVVAVGNKNGVVGASTNGIGVIGTSSDYSPTTPTTGGVGVIGNGTIGVQGNGDVKGVVGISPSGTGVDGSSENGTGVDGSSNTGTGVVGSSSAGYGGSFFGGLAPLLLGSSSTQGPPTSGTHSVGELYVDNQGDLFFCVASGTPGTWKTVQLV